MQSAERQTLISPILHIEEVIDESSKEVGQEFTPVPQVIHVQNILQLPDGLLWEIFEHLEELYLINVDRVCCKFHEIIDLHVVNPDLSDWSHLPTEVIIQAPLRYPRLVRELFLSTPSQPREDLLDEHLRKIVRKCLMLRSLSLFRCEKITDKALSEIGKHLPFLTDLSLTHCSRWLTDEGIAHVTRGCPDLTALDVGGCLQLTDETLTRLAADCKGLQVLKISKCIKMTDAGLLQVVRACRLAELHMSVCPLTDGPILELAQQGQLVNLACRNTIHVSDTTLRALSLCHNLESLNVSGCIRISDDGLISLAPACGKLERAMLDDCELVSDKGVETLVRVARDLKHLGLRRCRFVSDAIANVLATHTVHLQTLLLTGCNQLTNDGLDTIVIGLQELCVLDLSRCSVTDEGLTSVSRHCHHLTTLHIEWCYAVTDAGIDKLSSGVCSGLTTLMLSGCVQLTDLSLLFLCRGMRELDTLAFRSCPLITNTGLGYLTNFMPGLSMLDASGCLGISDEGKTPLRDRGCFVVDDSESRVSASMMQELHEAQQAQAEAAAEEIRRQEEEEAERKWRKKRGILETPQSTTLSAATAKRPAPAAKKDSRTSRRK